MGKDKNPRRVAENEAMAKLRMLRTCLLYTSDAADE